ncbi:unnamed protein product [Peniophora sp. CBMAI 1063]|nr:unnamed protein product [Peniophora sp. CBMAI 1063]
MPKTRSKLTPRFTLSHLDRPHLVLHSSSLLLPNSIMPGHGADDVRTFQCSSSLPIYTTLRLPTSSEFSQALCCLRAVPTLYTLRSRGLPISS